MLLTRPGALRTRPRLFPQKEAHYLQLPEEEKVAGILLSSLVPLEWGLGFAGTLSMLGIAYSLLNERTAWVAAIVSAAAAVAAFSLPLKLNILVAIAAAVTASLVMACIDRDAPAIGPAP